MALLSTTRFAGTERRIGESWDAHSKRLGDLLAEIRAKTAALPDGEFAGALLRFQVADGYAYYVVERTSPLTLQYFPYMDEYKIPAAHLHGLDLDDVAEHVQCERAWAKLMSRPRKGDIAS